MESKESQNSIQLIKYMTKFVTNFMKYGYGKENTHTDSETDFHIVLLYS